MDKSINNLFKMCFTSRNLTAFHRRLTVNTFQTFLCHSSRKETESNSIYKDLSNDPSDIFDYIRKNQECLTGQNCLEALQKLSKCFPKLNRLSRTTILTEQKDLLMLCNELDKRIKTLDSSQVMEAIQLLFKLGIPLKSIIFQSLLKNIQNSIHSLTDDDAKDLQKILRSMETSNLTKATHMALKSRKELKNADVIPLCSDLYNAIQEEIPNKEYIISILEEISKYPYEIPHLTAFSIFISMIKAPEIVFLQFGDLFKRLQGIIINNASNLPHRKLLQILMALSISQEKNIVSEELFNEQFIDSLITPLLSTDAISMGEGIQILSKLRYLGHFSRPLIDYLALKCFKNPKLITKMDVPILMNFISGLTISVYKPPFWESIQQMIIEREDLQSCSVYLLIRFLYNLAVMGTYPRDLISIVFQIKNEQFAESKFSTRLRFAWLYQLVKTLDPNYPGPWPSQYVLNTILRNNIFMYDNMHPPTCSVLNTLEKALGGPQYIKSNIKTTLFHFIDHVIVMRKGGFPVAINLASNKVNSESEMKSFSLIEDIEIPPESQVIAILGLNSGSYLRNVKELRGSLFAFIKSLEALKFIVIPIYLPEWANLNDRDKMPFIMNQIRIKCPTDQQIYQ